LFVLMLSPFSSSRSLPAPAPHSSAPATIFLSSLLLLSHLFDCCMHPWQIWRTLFLLHWRITNVQTSADGLVRALRLAGGGGETPSLTFPLPRQRRRRSAGFVVLGLQRFVFAMAVLKRSLEEGIDRGTHFSVTYTNSQIQSDGVF
jgi:hypothetical protein